MCMWHVLSGCRAIRQRERDAVARHGATLQGGGHALTAKCYFRNLRGCELRERLRVTARDNERVTDVGRTDIEKRDDQSGLKHYARWCFIRENLAEDATHVRLTPQLSGRAPPCKATTYHGPLQLLVMRRLRHGQPPVRTWRPYHRPDRSSHQRSGSHTS